MPSRGGSGIASEVGERWAGARGGSPVSASEAKHESPDGSHLDVCLGVLPSEAGSITQRPVPFL